MCVCVCVNMRERERGGGGREREKEKSDREGGRASDRASEREKIECVKEVQRQDHKTTTTRPARMRARTHKHIRGASMQHTDQLKQLAVRYASPSAHCLHDVLLESGERERVEREKES
jgi:hypothetical protein